LQKFNIYSGKPPVSAGGFFYTTIKGCKDFQDAGGPGLKDLSDAAFAHPVNPLICLILVSVLSCLAQMTNRWQK
jgi:hypothetical protein